MLMMLARRLPKPLQSRSGRESFKHNPAYAHGARPAGSLNPSLAIQLCIPTSWTFPLPHCDLDKITYTDNLRNTVGNYSIIKTISSIHADLC